MLDSSASISVFKNQITPALEKEIPRLQDNAANVEIWILESDPDKPKIYQGSSPEDMVAALSKWQPNSGATEPNNSLRIARSLVGAEGAVSYITDTPLKYTLPYHSSYISIGKKTPNCGLTGVTFSKHNNQLLWRAVIRNYSDSTQERTWHLETAKGNSSKKSVTLNPKSLTTIQGIFPPGQKRCRIVLQKDAFELDDTLPIIIPSPKPLLVSSDLPKSSSELSDRMLKSFPNLQAAPDNKSADLIISSTSTTPSSSHLIVFPQDRASSSPYLTGSIVAPKHKLTEGLNWQTVLVRASVSLPHDQADQVLLWQGNRALIYLRTHPTSGNQALVFNFDITKSNVLKQPATAVLLLRFCEHLRNQKIAPETRMTETSEPLQLTRHTNAQAPDLTINSINLAGNIVHTEQKPATSSSIRAINHPGFFTISQGDQTLFTSASYFADTREANFSNCATDNLPASHTATAINRHTRDDHLWRVWTCLILAAVSGAWYFTKTKNTDKPKITQ